MRGHTLSRRLGHGRAHGPPSSWPIRGPLAHRARWHGRSPSGIRHSSVARRRYQNAAARPGAGFDFPGALPPRSAVSGVAESPEHRRRLRHRRGDHRGRHRPLDRGSLHRHGVRGGAHCQGPHFRRHRRSDQRGHRDRVGRPVRPPVLARESPGAPRHQARQHHADVGRQGQGHGLWHRARPDGLAGHDDADECRRRYRPVPFPRAGSRRDR